MSAGQCLGRDEGGLEGMLVTEWLRVIVVGLWMSLEDSWEAGSSKLSTS